VKSAGLRLPKNYNDLIDVLRSTGSKFAEGNAKNVAKNMTYGKSGTGSMFVDVAKGLVKKIPGKTKAGESIGKTLSTKINRGIEKAQRGLVDVDIRAGHNIYQKLDGVRLKTKYSGKYNNKTLGDKIKKIPEDFYNSIQRAKYNATQKAKGAFVYKHDVPLDKSISGVADKSIKIDVPSVSAPIEKAKKAVLPMVGAIAINNQIAKAQEGEKERKGGDTVDSKIAGSREDLIEKIASMIDCQGSEASKKLTNMVQEDRISKIASVAIKASEFLKEAAVQIRAKDEIIDKLAMENKELHEQLLNRERVDRATKLASEMNEKGMFAKSEIEQKITEIVALNDDAYAILKQAVDSTAIPDEKNGIDSLTFLDGNYNINVESTKRTLADSINDEF
jgi:hypothetical protein